MCPPLSFNKTTRKKNCLFFAVKAKWRDDLYNRFNEWLDPCYLQQQLFDKNRRVSNARMQSRQSGFVVLCTSQTSLAESTYMFISSRKCFPYSGISKSCLLSIRIYKPVELFAIQSLLQEHHCLSPLQVLYRELT